MKRRIFIAVLVALALVCLIDVLWPDHHHAHFKYHYWPAFDALFGFVGCLVLIAVALGLGNLVLWRPTCSVQLEETDRVRGFSSGTLRHWFVDLHEEVKKNQPLADIETTYGTITIWAPLEGTVQKIFFNPGDEVQLGETVVDLKVSKAILHAEDEVGENAHA